MRILFLSNYYPPFEVGGYEQLCRSVAERLAQRGHDTAVLTSNHGLGGKHNDGVVDGAYRVLITQPDYNRRLNASWQFFLTRHSVDRLNRRWLRQVVDWVQPDVIFIWNLQGLTRWLALDAEALANVSVAYWLAGYSPAETDEFWHYWSLRPKLRSHLGWIKNGMRRAAFVMMRREGQPLQPAMRHVAVVSHFMRNKGIAEGTLPHSTRVIYNGVEVEQFFHPVGARGCTPLRLLLAGRIGDDKGTHTAVEAIGRLVNDHDQRNIHLMIAGSGRSAYLDYLSEMIQRFGLHDQITMTGWVPRTQLPAIMAESHVLLLPTIIDEAFSRVVLEAMAAGLAVIASDTGGTSEIVQHDRTGLLFPAGDSHLLASQIIRLLHDEDLRQQLSRAGQEVVRHQFSLDRMVDEVEDFLMEAVASRNSSASAAAI